MAGDSGCASCCVLAFVFPPAKRVTSKANLPFPDYKLEEFNLEKGVFM